MSERGSFCTEYIYCPVCLSAAKFVLLGREKYLCSTVLPSWDGEGKYLPIIAGKIGGLHGGEEIDSFTGEFIPQLEGLICHPLRIAVLAESGQEILTANPSGKISDA
ncbi:MAG TPA: hypothetical protein PKV98_13495 [Burkholderiaceae bacterium]|nr:hypothetical protein [Burkholderiaceae bacterium]